MKSSKFKGFLKPLLYIKKLARLILSINCLLLITSCITVRLIADYDLVTDEILTELQKKVSTYFVTLERKIGTKDADYKNYIQFFDNTKIDLNTLEIRAAAIDKNRIVQNQIMELSTMTNHLDSLHQIGFKSYDEIRLLKQPYNSAFTSILKLQLALRRGEKE